MTAKKSGGIKCPHCNGTGRIPLDKASIGDMILMARRARKMTQAELATAVGLSRAQIANLEAGRSDLPMRTLARFADALGVSMRELVPG